MNLLLPAFYVALSAISYGSIGYFGTRLFEAGFSVPGMLFWRFGLSAICIICFIKPYLTSKISIKSLFFCMIIGGVFYGISTFCYFSAVPYIGSGIAMVIFYSFPVLVALMDWHIDKKKLNPVEIISMILIFPGIYLLSLSESSTFNLYGVLFGLGSALFYGIYFYASKKTAKNLSPVLSSFMICFGNLLLFTLICFQGNHFMLPNTAYVWLQYVGFVFIGTVLPLFLLMAGLKSINVTKAAIISVLEPFSTVIIGVHVLNESMNQRQIIGIVLILSAAILVQLEITNKKESIIV